MLEESEKTMVVLMFKSNIQKQSVLIKKKKIWFYSEGKR